MSTQLAEDREHQPMRNRIDISYTKWNKHGEKDEPSISTTKPVNATTEFVDEINFASDITTDGPITVEMVNATKDNFDEDDLVKFQEILLDAEKPLYEGCHDLTKLSVIVKLLNLKGKYGCSDKFSTELLGLLKKMLPAGVDTYDASTKDNFNLRAIVLWTINDYPTLGTLCGCPYSRFKGKQTNNKASENQEDTRGRGGKIQKKKRNTTEEEGSSSQVNGQNGAYWKKFNIWYQKLSEYHKSMETIGILPDKHETNENEEGKPLSVGKSSKVSAKLFQKAHLYVIHNRDELVPYIERHKQVLKTENPSKRIAFLENEHSKSFAKWLCKEDNIVKKYGMRTPGRCADKSKGKRKLAYAHCICTLHLQLAFASKHLYIALAHCICRQKHYSTILSKMSWAVTVETSTTGCLRWMVKVTCGTLGCRTRVLSPNRICGYGKSISSPSSLVIIPPIPILARMNDSTIELRETFQAWLKQQVLNLDSYTPEPSQCQKTPIYYDDDDDEESSTPLRDIIIFELPLCIAITPDKFIKSSVENHVPNPSESKDECEYDVPDCDDSQTTNFPTFSNPLFNDSTSSDDKSSHEEVIHEMSFKTYSNPLFDLDEEIISSEFNSIHNEDLDFTPKNNGFDTESYLLESLLNRDTLMAFSPMIDSLLDEFSVELIFLKSISPGIDEADCDPEEDIHFVDSLFDPFMEEIDLFLASDGSIPPEIPSSEIKVHIEVLSVLWSNRLPIRTVRGRCLEYFVNNDLKAQLSEKDTTICIPTASDEFPLPEYFPTASEDRTPCPIKGVLRRGGMMSKREITLLLALPDEHQLRFSKYKTAQELWAAILKTFGGNEATKKTKKNQLKQQYGNFKAEGKQTLEQTFNRLQAIVSQLEFMDVKIEQDDLNQKFLTSLAPEWLMYTIVWRNRSNLDTMSLDDLYNHLKVYEPEVQKKSESNSQNIAFISSAKNSSGKEKVNTASFPLPALKFPLLIKYEDINQIDEDNIEKMDIKWNMALLSMRADRFWKKTTGKKITIQGTDVAGFDKSKVECFNCHKMGHFARECRAPKSQDRGRRENFKQGSKTEEQAPKALMAIDGVEARLVEFKNQEIKFYEKIRGLEFNVESKNNRIERLTNELEELKKDKEGLDRKLTGFQLASKDLDTLIGSQRSDKNNEGLGYNVVPPPPAQVYSPPNKDMSWTGLPNFVDDTITDYSRPSPSIESNSNDLQSSNSYVSENRESSSSILSKHVITFVKAADSPTVIKINKDETVRKSSVKYAKIDFKLKDDTNVLLRTPRQHNMYSIDLSNIVPHKDLTCLVAKASADKCMLWHKRLADAKLPVTFWAEAVNTACYVQNRVLDPEFLARVYKVEKAMYGLHQAPRIWYGTLSKYLLTNGFQRGDFILVQVYVDDIIFGSSNLQLCREFEALIHDKFQMSAMGELNFFLGLQVQQKKDGIFLSQDKYVGDILKKFGYSDVRSANTPMDKENPWGKDRTGKDVDLHLYRSMI
nr:putative ribonuclease H-like domain-containing protein [Tanacetum cinerariifolium]